MMRFERVRPGEYRAQLNGGGYVWAVREGRRRWVWLPGGYDTHPGIWGVANGPFPSLKLAIADAIANYS